VKQGMGIGGTSKRATISLKSEKLLFSIITSLIWAVIRNELGGSI
jgi:hypothetical protein